LSRGTLYETIYTPDAVASRSPLRRCATTTGLFACSAQSSSPEFALLRCPTAETKQLI
jgi:hypothetical protein